MPILDSQVDRNSDEFKRNREKMLAAIQEFRDAEASVQATSDKSRERFAKRKQLMPRERIALLLDRGAPFLELMPLAGYRMHDDKDGSSAGGGSVAGIGFPEPGHVRQDYYAHDSLDLTFHLACLASGLQPGAGGFFAMATVFDEQLMAETRRRLTAAFELLQESIGADVRKAS